MKRATQLLATILMIVFTTSLSAQDMKPKKYDNPQWYHIVYIDYEAGTMAKAKQIIDDYYAKASEKSGTPGPVLALEMNTGEYDMMIVWHLTEGLDELNWEITANNIKWQKNGLSGEVDVIMSKTVLNEQGIPHTLITDNTGGHLMQHNME